MTLLVQQERTLTSEDRQEQMRVLGKHKMDALDPQKQQTYALGQQEQQEQQSSAIDQQEQQLVAMGQQEHKLDAMGQQEQQKQPEQLLKPVGQRQRMLKLVVW